MRTVVFTVFLAGVVHVAAADACSCLPTGLPCEAAGIAGVVFVGHVVSIEAARAPDGYGSRRVELAVVEPFRGLRLTQVVLLTGSGGGDCGYGFRMGESYLVYARQSPQGHLSASICSRTRRLADATEDLAYLRSLAELSPDLPGRISGRVHVWEHLRRTRTEPEPIPGVMVTATGSGRTFSARTNTRGEFDLTGLPLGKYELVAAAPDGYEAVPRTVEIHDPRGCGTTGLLVRHDGRVSGRVVDSRGGPVHGLPIELVMSDEADKPDRTARVVTLTAADGSFELRLVPPGEYVLRFHLVPADRVIVGAGERLRLKPISVPENLALVTINGIVVDQQQRPVRDASVGVFEGPATAEGRVGFGFTTGEDGRFAFALIDGRKYDVHVTRYVGDEPGTREVQTRAVPFTASSATPLVTVVMMPNSFR